MVSTRKRHLRFCLLCVSAFLTLISCSLLVGAGAEKKADITNKTSGIEVIANPEEWSVWRSGPLNFPTYMCPLVPETLEMGPAVDLGQNADDVVIVLPELDKSNIDHKGLLSVVRGSKLRRAAISHGKLPDDQKAQNIILLGTLKNNPLANELLGDAREKFMQGIPAGGYHIKPIASPFNKGKSIIFALGLDDRGAWQAATILDFSFHTKMHTGDVGKLKRWHVDLPSGNFWAPFEAKYTGWQEPSAKSHANKAQRPVVPFGVRCWGSPTPSLETFKRMVLVLQKYGVNSMMIQPGGWPDLENAGQVTKECVDYAYQNGINSWLYVGNDKKSHLPAPLADSHREMVLAVKDNPGLIGWQLYNQLSSKLSAEQHQMIKDQIKWIKSVSNKPVGMEIVWGHDTGPIPEDKIELISKLREWGIDEIAMDYAPIGGWSKKHDLSLWEQRVINLREFENEPFVVMQAHVPFVEPTLPMPAEMRNQFWWCVAGGAKAFFFEAAYLYNHFSNRGLLTWTLEPVPDGRLDEVKRLSEIVKKLEKVITKSNRLTVEKANAPKVTILEDNKKVAVRVRIIPDDGYYILFINTDIEKQNKVRFNLSEGFKSPVDILTGKTLEKELKNDYTVALMPGGGTCLHLQPLRN